MLNNFFSKVYFWSYVRRNPWQNKDISQLPQQLKKILIISNTAFGDTLLSTPAIKSLKKSFPDSEIVALIHCKILPLFEDYEYIDYLIPYYGGYKKIFKTIREIKKHNIDIAMILHGNGPQDIQIAVLSGCKFILKHPTASSIKHYLSYNFRKKDQHTIEDRLDLVRKIGGNKIFTSMSIPRLDNVHLLHTYNKFKRYIGIQVGAADLYKMWPIDNFISLIGKMIEYNSPHIVLTGISSEYYLTNKIYQKYPNNIINMCGKCSIKELPYMINYLKLLITNDTGTMHLAIATKTPTLSLFSPTIVKGIGPYQDLERHIFIQKDGSYMQKLPKKKRTNKAMSSITVDEVFNKYVEAIQ